MDFTGKNVLIIGCPASGKTHLSNLLKKDPSNHLHVHTDHLHIHTDDYAHYGHVEALYVLIEELKSNQRNTIIEGIMGYRLLRKGVELDCYYPDIVLQLYITEQQMEQVYSRERDVKKLKYLKQFNSMQEKILRDYMNMPIDKSKEPEWIDVMNNY